MFPVAWIVAEDVIVSESVGAVELEFMITRGDNSVRTRAFAVTVSSTALEGTCACICMCGGNVPLH